MTDKANSPVDEGDALVEAVDDAVSNADRDPARDPEPTVLTEPFRDVAPDPDAARLPPEVPPMPRPAAPKPVRQQRSGWMGAVVGGVLAAGAGYAVAQFVPDGWPIADTSALEAQVATQATELAALQAELARVSELAATPQPVPDSGLADRIAALESATPVPAAPDLSADLTALAARLAALESQPASIGSGPAETGPSTAALAAIEADIAALKSQSTTIPADLATMVAETEQRLAAVQTQAEDLQAEAEAMVRTASRGAALGQLRAALDSGAPFAAALGQLGEAEIPTALSDSATTGVPSLTVLQAAFPDAARAALEASLRADMGSTWSDRVASYLRNQTGARSLTPRDGTDPDAILSRAEAALADGDLGIVLTELSALPPAGLAAMSEWQQMAGTRQSAVQAVARLSESLGE